MIFYAPGFRLRRVIEEDLLREKHEVSNEDESLGMDAREKEMALIRKGIEDLRQSVNGHLNLLLTRLERIDHRKPKPSPKKGAWKAGIKALQERAERELKADLKMGKQIITSGQGSRSRKGK